MKNENWPTFLIIGAGKAGTTSLYRYLSEHPDVFMSPKKEPNFFAFEGETLDYKGPGDSTAKNLSVTTKDEYLRLFADAGNARAIGEASPVYLYSEKAPERIHHYVPDIRLVAVLRQPVDRAYSAFMMMVRSGRESCHDFREVVEDQKRRQMENWGSATLMEEGFYFKLLSRYFERFDRSQIKVFLFEDIVSNVAELYAGLTEFIGVSSEFAPPDFAKHNVSGAPRSRLLQSWTSKSGRVNKIGRLLIPKPLRSAMKQRILEANLVKVPIDPQLKTELTTRYRDDILRLQDLIDRDLTHWLQ